MQVIITAATVIVDTVITIGVLPAKLPLAPPSATIRRLVTIAAAAAKPTTIAIAHTMPATTAIMPAAIAAAGTPATATTGE